MEGHAALPDVEDLDRIMQVLGQLVEQHVAETPAEHNSDHAIKQQVVEILVTPTQVRTLLDTKSAQQDPRDKGDQIHEAVPTNGQRAKLDGCWVELGMDEHKCAFSPRKAGLYGRRSPEKRDRYAANVSANFPLSLDID